MAALGGGLLVVLFLVKKKHAASRVGPLTPSVSRDEVLSGGDTMGSEKKSLFQRIGAFFYDLFVPPNVHAAVKDLE